MTETLDRAGVYPGGRPRAGRCVLQTTASDSGRMQYRGRDHTHRYSLLSAHTASDPGQRTLRVFSGRESPAKIGHLTHFCLRGNLAAARRVERSTERPSLVPVCELPPTTCPRALGPAEEYATFLEHQERWSPPACPDWRAGRPSVGSPEGRFGPAEKGSHRS